MIKKVFITIIIFLAAFHFANAESNMMFDNANQMYRNKMYDSAASLYQQILDEGYVSADLYYNAGNAYYRTNKIGMAIWCYKKALQLDQQKNYRENLALAQRKIKEPIKPIQDIFFIRWWKGLVNLFSINTWSLIAIISFLIGIVILFIKRIGNANMNINRIKNIAFTLTAFSFIMMAITFVQGKFHYRGIIVREEVLFQPVTKDKPEYLNAGTEVEFVSPGMVQMKVALPDGRIGMIDASAFKKL